MNKSKRILLVTETCLYQLSLNLSLVVKINIKDIKAITLIKSSSAVMAIHVNQSFDFLMETIRRTELILFLINVCDNKKLKRPELVQSSGLKIMKNQKEKIIDFDPAKEDISKSNKHLFHHLISNNFLNSSMAGYLDKRSNNWFKSWTEKFCVLCNVGLLYYNDPQKRPRNLFPTIDAQIIQISEGMFNRKYMFQLKSFTYDITFAAKSKEDYEGWMRAFHDLQKDTEQKKRELMKKQNIKTIDKGVKTNPSTGVKERQPVKMNSK